MCIRDRSARARGFESHSLRYCIAESGRTGSGAANWISDSLKECDSAINAEVPKWLKGLPWKGSRSLVAARGFKSLLLRLKFQDAECWKKLRKKFKKLLTNRKSCDKLAKLSLRKTRTAQNLENWTVCKTQNSYKMAKRFRPWMRTFRTKT